MQSKITKLFQTTPSSVDEANKTVTFTISDNQPDRMGEIVDQKSWDFTEYEANPIVLWGHNPDEAENVLGRTLSLNVAPDGSHTNAVLQFATDINQKAAFVFDMIKQGYLKTVSVGFLSGECEYEDNTPVLKQNKLLEISVVGIPANPRAFALAYKAEGITTKDAKWLIDSMNKEVEALEKQLAESQETKREKSMTDEQFKEVMDAVAKLAETVSANQTANNEFQAAVTEQLTALKPVEAPKPVEATKEEATQEAEAEEVEQEADAAKDGDNDQSGADDNQFNPEAPLTDELRAQIDAELAQLVAAEMAA